MSLFKIKILKT